ncbi:MAG: hypothetical protein HC821_01055 [Lewinella sp.]|nr:hypothetical protein [Lewinella sp.]
MNSVNHLENTAFFRSNVLNSFFENCGLSNPVAPDEITFDGFTTILTAFANVIPCETYHLKLIIADVGDSFFDSAVMLRAGSFAAGLVNVSEPGATAESAGASNAPIEGCSNGQLVFSRVDSNILQPLTVYFSLSPLSTATYGLDYTMPLDSFIIPAGQLMDTLVIEIFGDELAEGTENIILRLDGTCNCSANSTEFSLLTLLKFC